MRALDFILCLLLVGHATGLRRPHIVFIMADDLGYNDIGYHAKLHGSDMKTPFLDRLASEGVKLENYYVQPICTPSRSQLMSGRYQIHTGLQHGVVLAGQKNALPLDNILLPEQLRNCGYDTHMVGKWHLGNYKKEFLPQNRGFNSYFGYLNGAEDYFTHVLCRGKFCGVDMRNTDGPLNTTWGKYSAYAFTDRAKDVIDKREKSKPMFLYLSYQNVHYPVEVPEHYMKPFMHIKDKIRRTYAGMVAALDEAVLNVTVHLKEAGIYDDTIIIFSTDNGGHTGYGGNNWPLRGRKATLWEGGVKGVGFIAGGALKTANVEGQNFMHVSDWFPTILSATGCSTMPGTQLLDGFDQWQAILQKDLSPRKELLHNIDPLTRIGRKPVIVHGFDITVRAAIRSGPWKLFTGNPGFSKRVMPPESQKFSQNTTKILLSSEWVDSTQEIFYEDEFSDKMLSQSIKLFHIDTDPYEEHELSSKFPYVIKDLLRQLVKYNSTSVPARSPPFDENSVPEYHGGYWGPWVK